MLQAHDMLPLLMVATHASVYTWHSYTCFVTLAS
jgi:hypothetical protein